MCWLFHSDLSIDAMDVSGEQQIDLDHSMFKQRLSPEGENIEDNPEKDGIVFCIFSFQFEKKLTCHTSSTMIKNEVQWQNKTGNTKSGIIQTWHKKRVDE